jgi:hypothetical protein
MKNWYEEADANESNDESGQQRPIAVDPFFLNP